jgi:NAD-dependent DNA ligase
MLWFCEKVTTDNTYYDLATSDMQRLSGILHGIIADKNIKDDEIYQLQKWITDNEHLASIYPYDELASLLVSITADGIITDEERQLLERHILEYVDTSNLSAYSEEEVDQIKKSISIAGICALDPIIQIQDSNFHFTGKSSVAKDKKHFQNVVEALGGSYTKGVNNKLNYLVVGSGGSKCWAYACFGRKVESAIERRAEGQNLMIVHESDFWDTVEDIQ